MSENHPCCEKPRIVLDPSKKARAYNEEGIMTIQHNEWIRYCQSCGNVDLVTREYAEFAAFARSKDSEN